MVRKPLEEIDGSLVTSFPTENRTTAGSMSSNSDFRPLTPSSTTGTSPEGRLFTPSAGSVDDDGINAVCPGPKTPTLGPKRPVSPSIVQPSEGHASTQFSNEHDAYNRDYPLPSVEQHVSISRYNHNTSSTASTAEYTPSPSSSMQSNRQVDGQDDGLREIEDFRNFRLTSPPTSDSRIQRGSRTPSVHVTASIDRAGTNGDNSVIAGVAALNIDSLRTEPLGAHEAPNVQSPSPSRRRRSCSGLRKERHDIESEHPPATFAHMAEAQHALARSKILTTRLATILSKSTLYHENGSHIQTLHRQATELSDFQLPSSRIVGLVGDSGVGKSSLINSLLDKNLARASGSGTACTCAVTEYHFHERDDFIVHVDYFPMAELKKQFEELLRAYRDLQLLPQNQRGGNEEGNTDNDRVRLEKTSKLAHETFTASFGPRLECEPALLTSTPFEDAVATMVDWARQLVTQEAEHLTFSTVEECSSYLRVLASETNPAPYDRSPRTCWPFIQKVRVYLKAYILSKGLILADLPGLRDLNSARQAITERYVRECHQVLVVARIDRAVTDESIKRICELATRVRLSKVDIVCTRSEDTHTREALHDWPAERVAIEDLQKKIDANVKDMESLKEEIEDYEQDIRSLSRVETQELAELQKEYRKVEVSKKKNDFDLKRLIVELRNSKVSRRLRKEYCHHPIATALSIFCVSNTIYWDNRDKNATIALPYLEFSGIIALRRYCIGVVAQSRLQATRKFIKDEIPALIGSIELWVEAGSGSADAESKQKIMDAISTMQQDLDELTSPWSRFNPIFHTFETVFNNQVYMRMRCNGPQWSVDARQASMSWQAWHHSSYKAFCSNYGDYTTPKMGGHCWNEEAIQGMKTDISKVWDSFEVDLDAELERIAATASHTFTKISKLASDVSKKEPRRTNNARSAMWTLAGNSLHRKNVMLYGLEQASETFESKLSTLRADALSSVRTAFVGRLMEDTYRAANMEYGTGSDRRRKTIVTNKFGSSTLFTDHQRMCRDRFRKVARELQDQTFQIIEQQVRLIEADLQVLGDSNAISESEMDLEFKDRLREEVHTIKEEIERLGNVVGRVSS